MGSRIAEDLAVDFPGRVVVAGRDLERADATAAAIGRGVRGRRVDVTVAASIVAALDGVAVAVNCIDQPDRGLLWASIERGLAYTDITPHLTDLGREAEYERVAAAAKASGSRVLLGAGLVPGVSSVIVRALADTIGGADSIETALLLTADDVSGPASFDYLLRELAMPFDVHVDGVDRPARAFTSPRVVEFPAPLGSRRAYVFPFSDQVLYPRTMGARTVFTRLSIDPPGVSRLLALLVRTGGTRVVARERVRAALARLRGSRSTRTDAPYALRVDVAYGGRSAHATLTGRGQAHATAAGTAAVVRSLAGGEVAEPGAWMPEQVIAPSRFFERLARAGVRVQISAGEPEA